MQVVTVVGARPQFVKAAVVSRALAADGVDEHVVHTGQHYDAAMSDLLLEQLGLDKIARNLGVGSGSHAEQTAAMMVGLNQYLDEMSATPHAMVVYGDTNSSIAAALVASKRELPVVHVEAGLRSFNRTMPEEINRVVVDHLSDLLFCSSDTGAGNLATEGLAAKSLVVGDVMLDAFEQFTQVARETGAGGDVLARIGERPFALVTIHRPGNTDDDHRLKAIIDKLGELDLTCLWPVHPRAKSRLEHAGLPPNVIATEPLGYLEMLTMLGRCALVVTDSGGLQKEAYWARRRCITVRPETEWTETLEGGWNTLCDPTRESIASAAAWEPTAAWRPLYGDGKASVRIAAALRERFG